MAAGHPQAEPKKDFLRNRHKIGLPFPNNGLGPTELPVLCRCTMDSQYNFFVTHEIDMHTLSSNGSFGTHQSAHPAKYAKNGDDEPESSFEEVPHGERFILIPEEVIFLSFGVGCLSIQSETGESLSYTQVWKALVKKNPEFPFLYTVYHYFRSKNWVPKSGYKYGGDYILYQIGPEFYHATYIVHITGFSSRPKMNWMEVHSLQRLASTTHKNLLICELTIPASFSTENSTPKSIFDIQVKESVISRWNPFGKSSAQMDID